MILSKQNILYFCFATALSSVLGSLYFSEILHFVPCVLCWYQRVAMYPLVVIFFVGILLKDKNLPYFVLPLSIAGLLVSLYQNLLYFNILSEKVSPCALGVSCTARFLHVLGFLDIPQLSFLSFFVITSLMLIYKNSK